MNMMMDKLETVIGLCLGTAGCTKGDVARAVLKALMNPTHEMIKAGKVHMGTHTEEEGGAYQDANHCYQDMIELVLTGGS